MRLTCLDVELLKLGGIRRRMLAYADRTYKAGIVVVEAALNERHNLRLDCLIVLVCIIVSAGETDEVFGLARSEQFVFQIEYPVVKSNEMSFRI